MPVIVTRFVTVDVAKIVLFLGMAMVQPVQFPLKTGILFSVGGLGQSTRAICDKGLLR